MTMKFLTAFALCLLTASNALALDLKRGISTDTWVTWPSLDAVRTGPFVDVFPEWRRGTTAAEIANIRKSGFDFVRLTIDPAPFLHKPDAARTKKLLANVSSATDLFLNAGLNVVVDVHSIPRDAPEPGTESYVRTTAAFDAYTKVAVSIAKSIANKNPNRVAFEPFNEPTIDCPWDTSTSKRWPALALKLHKAVRTAIPKHTIVMQGACWGGAEGLTALDPKTFKDTNIIWTFHNYGPMLFTHQGASWTSWIEPYIEGLSFPSDAREKKTVLARAIAKIDATKLPAKRKAELKADVKTQLDLYFSGEGEREFLATVNKVKSWTTKHKIPASKIIVGEFGAIRGDLSAPLSDTKRAGYLRYASAAYAKQGWGWAVWSWGGSFGMTKSDSDRTMLPVLTKSLGLTRKP
jgi:endoglucanase